MTKLRIDMFNGTIEVDGDEQFVQGVYDDFKDRLLVVRTASDTSSTSELNVKTPVEPSKPTNRKRQSVHLSLIKDVDLSETANGFDLNEFFAAKAPQNAMESNVVFVYYLERVAQVARISVNHIYTCYKYVELSFPTALKQSLADTSSRKNWLDTSSFDDIKLSAAGENYVEHSLPKGIGRNKA